MNDIQTPKLTLTVDKSLLPQVIVVTGPVELQYAREAVRRAVDTLREKEEHNIASELYQLIAPFVGYV